MDDRMRQRFPPGKLPHAVLAELLAKVQVQDPRVVVGPGIGLDATVIDIGPRYLVAKTDPITFATDWLGWYAVHVNANDVACMGAVPRWFLGTLLLPDGAEGALAAKIFDQITQACESLSVDLVGGHTEITHGIDRPILVGCMLGEVDKDRLTSAAGARDGDALLLAGGFPIEAIAIMAREWASELQGRFSEEYLERCRQFLFEPGISVVRAAQLALAHGPVHAMHDPTEGGLATGLWELAQAAGRAIEVRRQELVALPEGQALCGALGLDPLASIASGALLLTSSPGQAPQIAAALSEQGIECREIGTLGAGDPTVILVDSDGRQALPQPARDEIARLFDEPPN